MDKLNNQDLQEIYGTSISDGYKSFLLYPKRKDSLTQNWRENDGIDIDLTNPAFEAREFRLSCFMTAASSAEFWEKWNGLFTELSGQGSHLIYIGDLDKTFRVYYKEMQNVIKNTPITSNDVTVAFDLIFGEVSPADNITPVYLVTEDGKLLIT